MQEVQVYGRAFVPYIEPATIQKRVEEMAAELNETYAEKNPIFLSVLSGAYVFTADLLRELSIPCEVYFSKYKSYEGTTSSGIVHEILGIPEEVKGRHIVVIEDIVETGHTIDYLKKKLLEHRPASVKICTLLFKPNAFNKPWEPDYVGFEIPDAFVVGYGLDYNGAARNLKGIYQLKD